MKSIIALENLIQENEARVKVQRRQLADHEAGVNKISRMVKAATETHLEEGLELIAKYKFMLEELLAQDQAELEEKQRIEEEIKRKAYFDNQEERINNNTTKTLDQKLQVMMIIDELPSQVQFEDQELFEIAEKTIELNIGDHVDLGEKLSEIKKEFEFLIVNNKEEKIHDIEMLNYRIPLLVLHFSVLLSNIKELLEKNNDACFRGFPKYEDWWIDELWSSHQAYFALYKWKSIISNLCITKDQKTTWSNIFDEWLFVKKLLNDKGPLAFEFQFAFDSLLTKHAELEEELIDKNLLAMESIIKEITKKEDFSKVKRNHCVSTSYLGFKREKLK